MLLQHECEDWTRTARILCCHLMGEPMDALFPPTKAELEAREKKPQSLAQQEEYVDQEKLPPKPAEAEGEAREGEKVCWIVGF